MHLRRLGAEIPSFCLCYPDSICEVEAGADHEAEAAEHVEDAAPDVGCYFHRARSTRRLPLAIFYFLSVFMPLADYAADG